MLNWTFHISHFKFRCYLENLFSKWTFFSEFILGIKVSKSRKQFLELSILPKNEQNTFIMYPKRSQDNFVLCFVCFFEELWVLMFFRDLLTFNFGKNEALIYSNEYGFRKENSWNLIFTLSCSSYSWNSQFCREQ